jgi:glycosyltransferase involved in cell wall biosynthesis
MDKLIFLSFESPFPAYSGATKRTLGLLTELAQSYKIDLRLLLHTPLTNEQEIELRRYAMSITQIPRRDKFLQDKLAICAKAIKQRQPYHVALVEYSFATKYYHQFRPTIKDNIYSNFIHWCVPILNKQGTNWIIDQHNADVVFWDIYARHSSNALIKMTARINQSFTNQFCAKVYRNSACIVSVCNEDKIITQQFDPKLVVDVIPNGVDCDYFLPIRGHIKKPVLLFTGTSEERNMYALRCFVQSCYPLILSQVPDVQFVIAGNFNKKAQQEFHGISGISFTGKIPDLRPMYNQSLVFVNPFQEAYGSKLKVSEALSMGICIVSFPEGVRGMPVVKDESILIGYDWQELAHQIVRVLQDPILAQRIGMQGRQVALQYLDWKRVLGPRLRYLVSQYIH